MSEREVLTSNDAFLFLSHSRDHLICSMQELGVHDFDGLRLILSAMSSVMVGAKELIY